MDEIDPAPKPKRRTFTAAEKLAHLDAFDALEKGSTERGAYVRREGLYSSHLSEWRKPTRPGCTERLGDEHGRLETDPGAARVGPGPQADRSARD